MAAWGEAEDEELSGTDERDTLDSRRRRCWGLLESEGSPATVDSRADDHEVARVCWRAFRALLLPDWEESEDVLAERVAGDMEGGGGE
jgi:hypothetical protein